VGFDATRATPSQLDEHCLPREPDPETQPALSEAWHRMFDPPHNWVSPEIAPQAEHNIPQTRQLFFSATTRYADSRNWCGAEIAPHGANQFVQIFGEWTVPTPVIPPPDRRGRQDLPNTYKNSTWIGLDGDRQYHNSSLPQVGTDQYLTVDPMGREIRKFQVFFQWWARDQVKLDSEIIRGIEIEAGMSVMGLIWAFDPTHVVFRNFEPLNQITLFVRESPQTKTIRPVISGATAEWIMERPTISKLRATTLELFAAYDKVYFKHCVAGMARKTGQSTSEKILRAPRFKRMFEVTGDAPVRTRFISVPDRIDTTSFDTHYV
jgi:hypothetical protein